MENADKKIEEVNEMIKAGYGSKHDFEFQGLITVFEDKESLEAMYYQCKVCGSVFFYNYNSEFAVGVIMKRQGVLFDCVAEKKKSDIKGEGYGSCHNWENIVTIPSQEQNLRHTLYVCRECPAVFTHFYHKEPDIFKDMERQKIKNTCVCEGGEDGN